MVGLSVKNYSLKLFPVDLSVDSTVSPRAYDTKNRVSIPVVCRTHKVIVEHKTTCAQQHQQNQIFM